MEPREINALVLSTVKDAQTGLLDKLSELVTNKLDGFQNQISETQRALSDVQVAKIELITTEKYKFNKKGNEEQHKVNSKVGQKMREAEASLRENMRDEALEKISQGMQILEHRQKLIKLADSSELGWRTVEEYETSNLADDSDDEKRMIKAENRAQRKAKMRSKGVNRGRPRRTHPYVPEAPAVSADNTRSGQAVRRPGTCFSCGKAGHWRFECREAQRRPDDRNDKISIDVDIVFENRHNERAQNEGEFASNKNVISPVGKLKCAYDKWVEIGANQAVLDIIKDGYRIPFYTLPESADITNNKSARDSRNFVEDEIGKLMNKGCISETYEKPEVINPLTVADRNGKLRLVLDCRHINPHLYKFKFKYEDSKIAKETFEEGDYIFGFDLKSAYHHIEIFEDHRTYIGFAWEFEDKRRYFHFNVLPFGISTAGYVFTKVTRTLIRYWRSRGENIIMFLDDGIGGASDIHKANEFSSRVQKDLSELGFLVAEDKCSWTAQRCLIWLGLRWQMDEGKVYIAEHRIQRLLGSIEGLQVKLNNTDIVSVKEIASVAGQIISMQPGVGKLVQLKTREMYKCINTRASWNAPVVVTENAKIEMGFWLKYVRDLNGVKLKNVVEYAYSVYTDASSEGYGGYVEQRENSEVLGTWSEAEKSKSSTWRELETVNRVLRSTVTCLEGQSVQWYTDNRNVVSIIEKGSKKPELQDIAQSIHDSCQRNVISLDAVWISRNRNEKADHLSRCRDSDDWYIEEYVYRELDTVWGKHTVDRFASNLNAKCKVFNSRWWTPGTSGVDAFQQAWGQGTNWWVPPPRLISKTVCKIVKEKAKGTLIIPMWKSAPFWPKVCKDGEFMPFVIESRIYRSGIVNKGYGNNGIFGNPRSKFKMVALHIVA